MAVTRISIRVTELQWMLPGTRPTTCAIDPNTETGLLFRIGYRHP